MSQENIDPLSLTSLQIRLYADGQPISSATGFVVKHRDKHFLITNWHVVTNLGGVPPDELEIAYHSSTPGSWNWISQKLHDENWNPRWKEHPAGNEVDLVALPLEESSSHIKIYPFDLGMENFDMLMRPAVAVSIIGFPLDLCKNGGLPVWKAGHIASDPDTDYAGKPLFLIDASTRGGMSGSPVVIRTYSNYITSEQHIHIGEGIQTKFIGVYSGRIHVDAAIGGVWKPKALTELLQSIENF